jgi:hypothetical protein
MRKILFLWVVVPCLCGAVALLLSSSATIRHLIGWARGSPIIECPAVVELGEQEVERVATGHVVIANRGRDDLQLGDIRSSCSCSGLERELNGDLVRLQELRLGAGESADLLLRVAVRGTPGESNRTAVTFATNDPERPEVRVEAVISRITGGVSSSPRTVIFGTVSVGGSASQLVEVRDKASLPRSIKAVESTNPQGFTVRLLPASSRKGAPALPEEGSVIGLVEVTLKTEAPLVADGGILVSLDESSRPKWVPVLGRVAPLVEVSPALVVLPRFSSTGAVYSAECLCRSTEGKPLTIAAESSSPGLTLRVHPVAGDATAKRVVVIWDPTKDVRGTPQRRTASVKAKLADHEVILSIPVRCELPEGS